jgi:hypothetical protein
VSFSAAVVEAAPRDTWVAANNDAHYFLRNYVTNEYKETIDCLVSYTFTIREERADGLVLYDVSRDMFVFLGHGAMWLWPSGATAWSRYKDGNFDRRNYFYHYDSSGAISGFFVKKNGCVWEEHFDGTGRAAFTFGQNSANAQSIVLYDNSRNMYVRLDDGSMWLKEGVRGNFTFFKTGSWSD